MFNQKVIKITLELDGRSEAFAVINEKEYRKVGYTGLRVSFQSNAGNGGMNESAVILIYGMPMDKMDKLLRIRWGSENALESRIKVEVGTINKLETVYQGYVSFARLDMSNAPDFALVIESFASMKENRDTPSPTTVKEGEKIQDVVKAICDEMQWSFTNHGVDIIASGPASFGNSSLQKIRKACKDYDFEGYERYKHLDIAPKNGNIRMEAPIISPKNGLIGYPTQEQYGIAFSCLYDPRLIFGGIVEVRDSVVKSANGRWKIKGVRTILDANMPNGNWKNEISATWMMKDTDVSTSK